MPDQRLQKARESLPSGYQFGDSAKPFYWRMDPLFGQPEIPIRFAMINPDFAFRLCVDSDDMAHEPTSCR